MANAPDAFANGGIVKINTDLLKDFAGKNLTGFLDDLDSNVDVKAMASYSESGTTGPAVGPSRHFVAVLPGNGEALGSAGSLKTGFHSLAGYVNTAVTNLVESAEKMQADLLAVAEIIDQADKDAGLTAEQMRTDLSDVIAPSSTTAPPTT